MGWIGALLAIAIFPFVGFGGIALLLLGGLAFTVRPGHLTFLVLEHAHAPIRHSGGWMGVPERRA